MGKVKDKCKYTDADGNGVFCFYTSYYDESALAESYYTKGIDILKKMEDFWNNSVDNIVCSKILSFTPIDSTGNAQDALMPFLIYKCAKSKDIWEKFVAQNNTSIYTSLDTKLTNHNNKYKEWNKHVEVCNDCNGGIQSEISKQVFTPKTNIEATKSDITGTHGVLFIANFVDMTNLIIAVEEAKNAIRNIEIKFDTDFGAKYFGSMKSTFDTYILNANTTLHEKVCQELDDIISNAISFTTEFNKLNKEVLSINE